MPVPRELEVFIMWKLPCDSVGGVGFEGVGAVLSKFVLNLRVYIFQKLLCHLRGE